MNISFLDEFNADLRTLLEDNIDRWQKEIEGLLQGNPTPSLVKFDNTYLIKGHGTGGFADAGNVLILAFQLDYTDRDEQLHKLRASYLHESYHLGQGWVGDVLLSPIDEAILEGAATVFERDRADANPTWSQYYDKNTMIDLLHEISKLDSSYDHQKWKYYDENTGKSHLLYRAGTFIVDEALRLHPGLTIEKLVSYEASEILKFSKLL